MYDFTFSTYDELTAAAAPAYRFLAFRLALVASYLDCSAASSLTGTATSPRIRLSNSFPPIDGCFALDSLGLFATYIAPIHE